MKSLTSLLRATALPFLTFACLYMLGCASQLESSSNTGTEASKDAKQTSDDNNISGPSASDIPAKPFEVQTLYSLLVAEMAGDRQRYDIALGNYMQEAERTRDRGVTARATRIAVFLNAHKAALKMSLLWAEIEPNNAEALFNATTGLTRSGRLSEAFTFAERLQQLGSQPLFLNIAAQASLSTDTQREQLLKQFNTLLVEQPNDSQLLVGKGLLLQQQNKPKEALVLAQQALSIKNDDMQAAVLEAKLLYQLNQPENALQRLVTLLQQNPNNQRLRLQYARLLANIDMGEAQKQFELLAEQSPSDPDILFSLGLVAQERRDMATAEKSFVKLLEMNERVDSAHYYLGQVEESKNNLDAAISHYQNIKKGQEFLPALNRTIDIMTKREQLSEVNNLMDDAREQFPAQTEQLYLIQAQAFARNNQLQSAEAILTTALTAAPDNGEFLFSRAMIREQRGHYDAAETDLRAVIKYQPNNASALNALGYSLAERTNRLDEALQLITQALNIRPDDPAIIDSMGWIQFRLGNYEDALLRLRIALKAFPDHEVASHLGEVLWVTGDKEQAQMIWQEGLRLNPQSTIIPQTIKRLSAD